MQTRHLHTVVTIAWFALVIGGGIVLLSGTAEPYVSTSQLPGEELSVFVGIVVLFVVGGTVGTRLRRRAWRRAGRQVGLTPEGGGVLGGRPDFGGTVRGRPVEVWTHEWSTGHGETKETHEFVVVEAGLARPIEDGSMVVATAEETDSMAVNVLPDSTVPDDATFEVVGPGSAAHSDAIIAGRSLAALRALERFAGVAVGDASEALGEMLPDSAASMMDAMPGTNPDAELEREARGDASTVSHTIEGVIYEGEDLQRQVDVVVAVADAVEDA